MSQNVWATIIPFGLVTLIFYWPKYFFQASEASCAKHSLVGSSIASGMAAAITTGHPTSNWRDEAVIQARGGCTRY